MDPPDRVTVPTCIGCGAMERWGTCATSCSEHKLELVGSTDFDGLHAARSAVKARIKAFLPVAEGILRADPGPHGWQRSYTEIQRAALAVLHQAERRDDSSESADYVTAWWCAECGGIESPQPCLGICVWRPADWVNRTAYEAERSRASADRGAERALVRLLRRVAFVTPHDDQWERNWLTLRVEAREALRSSPVMQAAPAPQREIKSRASAGGSIPPRTGFQ